MGNTNHSASGSVQQFTCPFHLLGTIFSYVLILHSQMLPDIFLAFNHATLISLFPASFPKHGSSTLAGFSQVSRATVPECHGTNQKTELAQEVGPHGPKELAPTFACGAGMSWKAAPRPACRQRLAPARWLPACSAHRQAQNSADFLGCRHRPRLGMSSNCAACRDRQELSVWAPSLSCTKHEGSRRPAPGPACG